MTSLPRLPATVSSWPRVVGTLLLATAMPLAAEDASDMPEHPSATGTAAQPGTPVPDAPVQTIQVTGSHEDDFHVGTGGSGTKLPTSAIPQSSTVVDQEQLQSQGLSSLKAALQDLPGVTMQAGEGTTTGDRLYIRGFADGSDIYEDDLKDNGQYFRDLYNIDAIELLRGPSGMLFGPGATGGALNLQTKKPTDTMTADGSLTYGSWNLQRQEAGAGGPIVGKTLGLRIDEFTQSNASFRNDQKLNEYGIAPTVAYRPFDQTKLLLQVSHQFQESNMDYGLPMYYGRPVQVPISTYYGFKDDSFQRYRDTMVSASIDQHFSKNWWVQDSFRYGDYDRTYRTEIPGQVDYANLTVPLRQSLTDNPQTDLLDQVELHGRGHIAGHQVSLVVGAEVDDEHYSFRSLASTGVPSAGLFAPDLPDSVGAGRADAISGPNVATNTSHVVAISEYALASVSLIDHVSLVLGGRVDHFGGSYSTTTPPVATVQLERADTLFSPRAGLIYKPNDEITIYADYSTSYDPSEETFSLNVATADLAPERTRNLEVGVKQEIVQGRLWGDIDVFREEMTNLRTTDPNNTTLQVLSGDERIDGIEGDLHGKVTSDWNVFGGIAFYHARVLESNSTSANNFGILVPIQGNRPIDTPALSGSLWSTYDLGWGITAGAGFSAVSTTFTNAANTGSIPGYIRIDASLSAHHACHDMDLYAQVNVYNLTDITYFTAGSSQYAYPGAPINERLTLGMRF